MGVRNTNLTTIITILLCYNIVITQSIEYLIFLQKIFVYIDWFDRFSYAEIIVRQWNNGE